ncbi:acyl-CoA/acyl-ACP dehydrogenase [Romeria aff. gracilis LEGE 07310]|uniref:Acyl-CoA/acyl-ACP dehydrogenase n=1 Tax=Vasconcelosia minhoensis LEGE 07310 TaxID=915328 RepID=A0A8J7A6E9_9CYAN|nr:acyl-CoA dehydrogenase family protein [Romeria gracilis]MBE9077552.1 acyl-CoA/acyl-ACP dehydrogenase [Romeria aff. gracilis LEGE 07310]
MTSKTCQGEPFGGLGYDYDPQWVLTPQQQQLQTRLRELCATVLRPNAIASDRELIYPRENFEALASLGLLGLLVPAEWGGLGENHVCAAMVVETIARYGCPSTAMCYTMHLGAVAAALFRAQDNPELQQLLKRLDAEVFIGTLSYSDPETGSHFWYPVSSRAEQTADGWQVFKKASWTTSAGFADWYVVQTTSPNFDGDFSDLSCFLIYRDEVQAEPHKWDALGLRGNQSGTLLVDGVSIPSQRMIGPSGDGAYSNDEIVDPFFLLCSSACWNEIAMGAIDIAKKHVTRKKHVDVGLRVADYPTIQDYFGEAVIDTNACRMFTLSMGQLMDQLTHDCDWSIHQDATAMPRSAYLHWYWQIKFAAAKNVAHVCDKMLHACGGSGYKKDMEIERYLRDGKAGWVMGPTNEVLRQFVGKSALLGFEALDYWSQQVNERVLHNEVKKMDAEGKRQLAEQLLAEVEVEAEQPAVNKPLVASTV